MRHCQLWSVLTALFVACTEVRLAPVNSHGGSGSGVDRSFLSPQPSNVGLHAFPSTARHVVPKVEPNTAWKPGFLPMVPAAPEPFLLQLPAVRTDVVHSMLSDKLSLGSNEPVKQILRPEERKALRELGQRLFENPDVTWSHFFVDEPQMDLTYKKHLYIATPNFEPGWQSAVGWSSNPETQHWLPIFFYRVQWDGRKHTDFNLAGIEVIKNPDEVVKVHTEWDERETLQTLLKRHGRSLARP